MDRFIIVVLLLSAIIGGSLWYQGRVDLLVEQYKEELGC